MRRLPDMAETIFCPEVISSVWFGLLWEPSWERPSAPLFGAMFSACLETRLGYWPFKLN